MTSFALWSQGFALWQQYPRAQTLAGQLMTAVNITRSALVYTQPAQREALLAALNKDERVGVYLREVSDVVEPLESTRFLGWLASSIEEGLGSDTVLTLKVNGETGLWLSFYIGGKELGVDSYWLRFDRARLEPRTSNPTRWWIWMALAFLVALMGSAWITRRMTQPLSALAESMAAVAELRPHAALPESGAKEIAQLNTGMNRMVRALAAHEAERNFMLASLSHDLRTPLARLRLEAEMAHLPEPTFTAMVGDIAHIDAQLTQFTDFVASSHPQMAPLSLTQLVNDALGALARNPQNHIDAQLCDCRLQGDARWLNRALSNVFENASRYGRSSDGHLHLTVRLTVSDQTNDQPSKRAILSIRDAGAGAAAELTPNLTPNLAPNLAPDLRHLLQPFTRGNAARSNAQGSGLGLAIVARVVQLHGGTVVLSSALAQGFGVEIELPVLTDGA